MSPVTKRSETSSLKNKFVERTSWSGCNIITLDKRKMPAIFIHYEKLYLITGYVVVTSNRVGQFGIPNPQIYWVIKAIYALYMHVHTNDLVISQSNSIANNKSLPPIIWWDHLLTRFVLFGLISRACAVITKSQNPIFAIIWKCSIILLQIPSHTSRAWCMLSLWYGDPIRIKDAVHHSESL